MHRSLPQHTLQSTLQIVSRAGAAQHTHTASALEKIQLRQNVQHGCSRLGERSSKPATRLIAPGAVAIRPEMLFIQPGSMFESVTPVSNQSSQPVVNSPLQAASLVDPVEAVVRPPEHALHMRLLVASPPRLY